MKRTPQQEQERFIRLYLSSAKLPELVELREYDGLAGKVADVCVEFARTLLPEGVSPSSWDIHTSEPVYEKLKQRLMADDMVRRCLSSEKLPSALEVHCDRISHAVNDALRRQMQDQPWSRPTQSTYR